jgi:hypothetical protein
MYMTVTVFYSMIPCSLVEKNIHIISYSTLNTGQYFSLKRRQIFSGLHGATLKIKVAFSI